MGYIETRIFVKSKFYVSLRYVFIIKYITEYFDNYFTILSKRSVTIKKLYVNINIYFMYIDKKETREIQ